MTDPSAPTDLVELNDGVAMPRIGYGTYKVGDDEAQQAVEAALSAGYRLLDTAEMYGNEVGVGRAVAASGVPREEVFLTTKVWNDHHGADAARAALEASLERLGTDYLDLYLIHWPSPKQGLYVETFEALLKAKEDGLIRSAGVSNFLPEHLDRVHEAAGVYPSVNQVELHPYFNQRELRAWQAERGIATESWGPLGQRTGSVLAEPAVAAAADAHGKSPGQVVIRWHLQHGCVVIPKSSKPSRIAENFDVFDFALSADEMAAIDALETGVRQGIDPGSGER
ncbi:aldo/keto reductase [Glycomyces algeriensis]|uniref:Oxidoreductase n=1 Tax=Glycomyces algeriensis TaxID=256037 RepID=A0A9W6G9P6_9ACTN|nr:aldo/keto reductase [Glycomyces algeriensis]MDA1364880.1 aldo/keto reductase [Glycomyces algeriensis]MDR7350061.1 2,5-diketo-D-gluconate reductase A [Glycomyces algeriensis]GLI42773.1 putative oxidoreductase [Glycomyces algeriensis]